MSSKEGLQSALQRTWDRLSPEMKREYGEEFLTKSRDDNLGDRIQRLCSENIQDVVDCYIHALLARYPRARYLIGKDAKLIWMPFGCYFPEWIGDWVLGGGRKRPIPAGAKR